MSSWKFSPAASFVSAIPVALLHRRSSTGADSGGPRSRSLALASPYTAVILGAAVFLLLCLDGYLTTVERATAAVVRAVVRFDAACLVRLVGAGEPDHRQPVSTFPSM